MAIAACAQRHRAALLLTLYEPPSGAGDDLVRVAQRAPLAIEKAMLDLFVSGEEQGRLRAGLDYETMADRLCQVLLHVSLGVFNNVRGGDAIPPLRCHAVLDGIAVKTPANTALDRSHAFAAANRTIDSWANLDDDEDERLPMLRGRGARASSAGAAMKQRPCAISPRPPVSARAASTAWSDRRKSCWLRSCGRSP